jgi:hypothetical protein
MRTIVSGILLVLIVGSAAAGQRRRIATLFDGLPFDGVTGPATSAVVPTERFAHVTMVSRRTDSNAPDDYGFPVRCVFTMEQTTDPSTTLSVDGFEGVIGKNGFTYVGDILRPLTVPTPVLGPYLVCSTVPRSLGTSAKLTLKAVFTK